MKKKERKHFGDKFRSPRRQPSPVFTEISFGGVAFPSSTAGVPVFSQI